MKDEDKTKAELIKELKTLRKEREKGVFKNIINYKEAEEKLEQSEKRHRIISELSTDYFYSLNVKSSGQMNIEWISEAFERVTTYPSDEIKNFAKWMSYIHPDDISGLRKNTETLLANNCVISEYRLFTKNGETRWFSDRLQPEWDGEQERVSRVYGAVRDITKRKQAERALIEAEERYHTVFENTGTATMIIEEDRTISMVNTQGEKLSGYSKKEIENKMKWTGFVIPEDLKVMVEYHTARRKTGEKPPTEYEFRFIDRKGKIKNIFLKVGLIPGSKKSIASLTDITKRKQAEENVKNIKDELQMILDSVPALIFYKDTESRIVRANKTLTDSLRMPIKDIIGKTTEELFPKEQAEKMRKDDKEVIVSGKPKRDITQPYTTPDGIRWLTTDKIPYKDKEGKVIGVIDLSKDITVQRKSEQELQQTHQRLKKTTDAAIDTMSKIIEAKDPYTSGHQRRVCQLAVPLAQELGLSQDKIEGVKIASLIHDIGVSPLS